MGWKKKVDGMCDFEEKLIFLLIVVERRESFAMMLQIK